MIGKVLVALLCIILASLLMPVAHSQATCKNPSAPSGYYGCFECYTAPVQGYCCPSSCPSFNSSLPSCSGVGEYGVCTQQISTASCGLLPQSIASIVKINEPWYCPINQQIYEQWRGDLPIALIAVLISFIIASIILMMGVATRNDKIRNFGIGEIYEALASAIIVGLFLYVAAVLFGVLPSSVVANINPYPFVLYNIHNTINSISEVYSGFFYSNMFVAYVASLTVKTTYGDGSISIPQPVGTILSVLYSQPIQTLGTIMSDGLYALWGEYYLIVAFSIMAIPGFLVPGIILRSIFPTRALGGNMIAIAMGFYLVMPTLFAVAYFFTSSSMLQSLQSLNVNINRFNSNPSQISSSASNPDNLLSQSISAANTAMSDFWLQILFYPSLIIAVTYAFIQQVGQFIGGATRMPGKIRGFI